MGQETILFDLDLFYIYVMFNEHLTNRFQVAVRLFSNRSQRTSKYGKNISDTSVIYY